LRKARQPVNAPFNSHPIPSLDVMRLTAEQVSDIHCLLGGEIALLPLCHIEKGVERGLLNSMPHVTKLQESCINMQLGISIDKPLTGSREPEKEIEINCDNLFLRASESASERVMNE
jgi:hypothetical protein